MKIKDLQFETTTWEYYKPFHITNSISSFSTNISVSLKLDDGTEGCGEASPSFRVNGETLNALVQAKDPIFELIKGEDVRNYRRLFSRIDKFSKTAPSVKAAVQYSILDALSKEIDLPVYQILGGASDYVETDQTICIGTLEETVEEAKKLSDEGFKVIKLKVGEDLKGDIERLLAVREAVPHIKYIVDANMGYTPKEAIYFSDILYREGFPMEIYEQPVVATDFDGLRFVRNHSPYPVGADESVRTKYDALRLIREECVDYLNIKLMKTGVSDALAIVEMAETASISLMIGCMSESGVGISQSIHFAAATGAFSYCDLDAHLLKKGAVPYRFRQEGVKLIPTI